MTASGVITDTKVKDLLMDFSNDLFVKSCFVCSDLACKRVVCSPVLLADRCFSRLGIKTSPCFHSRNMFHFNVISPTALEPALVLKMH